MDDVRFGLRILARNPGTTALIVALLSIGIGAGTTIFTLFDAVLIRPLPVTHPEQLVRIVTPYPKPVGPRSEFPLAYYQALRARSQTVAVFAESSWREHFRLTEPAPAADVAVDGVTPEFFSSIESRPQLGRLLTADDATRTFDTPPAVVSYEFWQKRFGSNRRAINGATLSINGHRFSIVGVLARGFHGISIDNGPDVQIPLQTFTLLLPPDDVDQGGFAVAGRLKPGATLAQAQAECLTIWRPVMRDYFQNVEKLAPGEISRLLQRGIEVESLERGTSILRDNFENVFHLLMASVALLLVIVALNVAGILLAQAATRQREMAVRLAIGGSRWRIARQLFIESILLAACGAVGGLIVSLILTPLAVDALPPVRDLSSSLVPISLNARPNWRVFCFLLASASAITILFTASPVVASLRMSADHVLRSVRSTSSLRGRRILIIAQVALCTFLLACAGLLVRSFEQLRSAPSGFAIDSIATFRCGTGTTGYPPATINALIQRVNEIPGVVSAATSSIGVLRGHGLFMTAVPAGQRITRADFMNANANSVSLDYFRTMGMHLAAGRNFMPADAREPKQTTPIKTIVNQALVAKLFPGSDGIGKRFGAGGDGGIASAAQEIIGVVSDTKYRSLREPVRPVLYSLQSAVDSDFMLNVRTSAAPAAVLQPVRQALADVAPNLDVLETATLAEAADEITAPERITATLASLFGAIATVLAGIGIYGLLAYAVARRQREIGIRMALGAQPAHITKLIASQTLVMIAAGTIIGLGAAIVSAPAIRSLLYGVSPHDPASLTGAAVFVSVVALLATVAPAWKAIQVQPSDSLRIEA